MAILNVSLVTKAIKRVIELSITGSIAWSPRAAPTISVLPPDKLESGSLGIYLYHVSEDPALKNQPPASTSTDPTPVRFTPMALNLYYLITTDAKADTEVLMLDAQLLLGLAIKTLHDYPLLSDNTEIGINNIFDDVGLDKTDTRLRITMQPVALNEAVNYWTAGQSPLRLSAYYNVSVVLLEPEPPPSRAGLVLDYGVHTFVTGSPRLNSTQNKLSITIPGSSVSQDIELQPAQVPFGGRFELHGVNLSGDDTQCLIANNRWSAALKADMAWGISATGERIIATVQGQIDGQDILPGIYTAKALVAEYRRMPDGSTRSFEKSSNETPFTITPRIDSISAPDPSGNVAVTGFRFQHADIATSDVQVFLGTEPLASGTAGSLSPGEYAITDASNLELRLMAGTAPGHVPFRLLINGAESPPAWIEVT
jgi:hypothetical protein